MMFLLLYYSCCCSSDYNNYYYYYTPRVKNTAKVAIVQLGTHQKGTPESKRIVTQDRQRKNNCKSCVVSRGSPETPVNMWPNSERQQQQQYLFRQNKITNTKVKIGRQAARRA